jgi:hypothetical protein
MADILLHLWRTVGDFGTDNSFFGMTQGGVINDSNISARSSGTMERFILRILDNTSLSLVTLDFLINGIVIPNSQIQILGVGQTGTFLPISQLPVPFLTDDNLVIRLTGINVGAIRAEIDMDLKFTI